MTTHTQEPWKQHTWHDGYIDGEDGRTIAHAVTTHDAARIVACVNACAGIPTAALPESVQMSLSSLEARQMQLVSERDELEAEIARLREAATTDGAFKGPEGPATGDPQ